MTLVAAGAAVVAPAATAAPIPFVPFWYVKVIGNRQSVPEAPAHSETLASRLRLVQERLVS